MMMMMRRFIKRVLIYYVMNMYCIVLYCTVLYYAQCSPVVNLECLGRLPCVTISLLRLYTVTEQLAIVNNTYIIT